ncbi:hypothetical protein P3T36_006335 [Kitasatospora sp. MAP12-15]|uniref:hypothetical protein n=1 Tax=unclassified Kitasatospora TaxID=2633591 RepID=UPI0024772A0B|nr:hypothetical protein [Kitasatospora sp. MAP12-44]MDH6107876.1 hypothetical protein [Kitasatospora sp. MAP12-44]
MTTSTAIPTARERKRRTCTKNVSCKPPLRLSELPRNLVDLTPRAEHVGCPDCKTWCPLTTHKGSKDWKLVPHHTTKAGTPGARRCGNSNRLFTIDMPITEWEQRRAEAIADVAARRPTTVLKKVKTPVAPAITQLDPAPATADSARRTYETHRSRCAACTGKEHCRDGKRLGADYLRLLRREPEHRRNRALYEEVQAAAERDRVNQHPARRAAEWHQVDEAVKAADTQRSESIRGARSPIFPLTLLKDTPAEQLKLPSGRIV